MNTWNIDSDLIKAIHKLIESSEVVIDRKKGDVHPRYSDIIYPLDYGFLKNTVTTDGSGIDVWLGELKNTDLTAIVCTCDLLKRDIELKLLLGCTKENITTILKHHNQGDLHAGVIWSHDEG